MQEKQLLIYQGQVLFLLDPMINYDSTDSWANLFTQSLHTFLNKNMQSFISQAVFNCRIIGTLKLTRLLWSKYKPGTRMVIDSISDS